MPEAAGAMKTMRYLFELLLVSVVVLNSNALPSAQQSDSTSVNRKLIVLN